MTGAGSSELLVRAAALYLPISTVVALALHLRPDRRRIAAALLATAWNLPALLAVNLVAVRAGWWTFAVDSATIAGVPADLWIGWALLWGAVPVLATTGRRATVAVVVVLVLADLVLMPLAGPVVSLDGSWLIGEVVAVVMCLLPGLLLGRWTALGAQVGRRAALQVVAFGGLLFFVLPSLIFETVGAGWSPLLGRPGWHLVVAAVVLAPAAATALQAVAEFAAHGGTPVPLDPPPVLVTTGPYAYVANPMQLGGSVLLAGWGVLLSSPVVVAAAGMAVVFSAGLAAWSEEGELSERFGPGWREYRKRVRCWAPRWRPVVTGAAVVHVAASCDPCREVGGFLSTRATAGLEVRAAERSREPLTRITYRQGVVRAVGVAAIGRSLEHVNLAWAVASWIGRLPVVEPVLQLITDAVGGEPRAIDRSATDPPGRKAEVSPSLDP